MRGNLVREEHMKKMDALNDISINEAKIFNDLVFFLSSFVYVCIQ